MKYYVSVTETLNKVVSVEAENEEDAWKKVNNAYGECEVTLGADNFIGHKTKVVKDQEFYRNEELQGFASYQEIKP